MNRIILLVIGLMLFFSGFAQDQSLKIGYKAPFLSGVDWIKGKEIPDFKEGTIYVVEMGATWCKPCIAAMPELSKLAKKYEGEVEVVGIFVKEADLNSPAHLDRIRKFVEKQGERMSYNVAADDPGKKVERKWINAYGASRGIPQTFVVDQEGRLVSHFSGLNPVALDELLSSLIDGSFDLENRLAIEHAQSQTFTSYNWRKPLLVNGNGGEGDSFLFRSILVKADGSIRRGPTRFIEKMGWVNHEGFRRFIEDYLNDDWDKYVAERRSECSRYQTVNTSISELYQFAYADTLYYQSVSDYTANQWTPTGDVVDPVVYPMFGDVYGEQWKKPIIEVANPDKLNEKFHYSLKVPDSKASAAFLQECMRADFDRYFGYDVKVEVRIMPCWLLKAKPGVREKLSTLTPGLDPSSKKLETDAGIVYVRSNFLINDFIHYLQKAQEEVFPIIDTTEIIDGDIDYQLSEAQLKKLNSFHSSANTDFDEYRNFLEETFGLYLKKSTKEVKVVVIRDSKHGGSL